MYYPVKFGVSDRGVCFDVLTRNEKRTKSLHPNTTNEDYAAGNVMFFLCLVSTSHLVPDHKD